MRFFSSIIICVALIPLTASRAWGLEILVGAHQVSANVEQANYSNSVRPVIVIGSKHGINSLTEYFKTGLLYKWKQYNVGTPLEHNPILQYFEIPVHAAYSFSELFGIYGGLGLSLLLNSECNTAGNLDCQLRGSASSIITPVQIGIGTNFSSFGLELEVEDSLSPIWKSAIGRSRSIGINIKYFL